MCQNCDTLNIRHQSRILTKTIRVYGSYKSEQSNDRQYLGSIEVQDGTSDSEIRRRVYVNYPKWKMYE